MIEFMLDTSTCVDLLRGRDRRLVERMVQHKPNEVAISSITLAELEYGAAKSSDPARHAFLVMQLAAHLPVLPFEDRTAQTYGQVRVRLEQQGTPIGPLDMLIASHALSLSLTLVTGNEREFRRVKGLTVENWLRR
jgi:tRNA(fMet)-specific endonuclease VapC